MTEVNPYANSSESLASKTTAAKVFQRPAGPVEHAPSSHSRLRRKLLRAFSAHSLGNAVTLADRFLLLPVMLLVWGPVITGIWMTIRALPAVLSVGELGFASAAGNQMTDHVHRHEQAQAARVYWGCARLIGLISSICVVLAFLTVLLAPLTRWFRCDDIAAWEFNTAVLCMTIYTVSVFQTQLTFAGFRSLDMQAFGAFGIHAIRIFELLLVVAVLVLLPKVWAVASAYLLARLSGALALRNYLLRQATWLHEHRGSSWSDVRPLIKPALGFGALPIAQSLQLQGVTMVIAAVTNPKYVTAFVAMRTLARFPIQFSSTLGRTVWPELSQALAKGDRSIVVRLHQRMMLLSLALNLSSVLLLMALGGYVFDFWTRGKLEFSWWTFTWLSLASGVSAYSANAMTLLNAMSRHGRASLVWVITALLSVLAVAFVPESWGIAGMCVILLVAEVLVLFYITATLGEQLETIQDHSDKLTKEPA